MSEEKTCWKRPIESVTVYNSCNNMKKLCGPKSLVCLLNSDPDSQNLLEQSKPVFNEFDCEKHYANSPLANNSVMKMAEINKTHFPNIEEWNDENKGLCENLKEDINDRDGPLTELSALKNSINTKSFEENSQLHFKTYNKRRLSDSFPAFQHLIDDSISSSLITKKLSKFLPLLLIQGLTKIHVSEKTTSFLPQQKHEMEISNILQSLLTVLRASFETPTEKQTLEYCQTVLEETTIGVADSFVICYFLKNLLSSDPLLKQAALTLLCSYCSERQFNLSIVRNLLKSLISLYGDDNLQILELSWKSVNLVIQNLKYADQIKIVPDVCLAVKWAVFHSKDKKYLPGLCHSKGFDSIFPLYEKVMLKGIMKDIKLAAQALHQLIMFSSDDALQPSLCSLAGVLICIILKFKDEPCVYTKIALVETLTALLAKVGVKLKLYFPQIQSTYLTTMRTDNRALQLKCIRGLCCVVRFSAQLDILYDYLCEGIKREGYATRRIMLFALRCIVKCACVSIPENWCRKISVMLLSMLNFPSDACRIAAAGCIGTIFGFLPPHEYEKVMKLYFLDDNQSLPWTLRHSKCTALMVTLKEFPVKLLLEKEMSEKICELILSYMTSHKVDIVVSSIKACGYFMLFKFSVSENISDSLLTAFCETMNHNSGEVRCTFALVINFLANRITVPLYVIKQIVPLLINGTKDGHKKVKSSCESALVAVLDSYTPDKIAQIYMNSVETTATESLQNVITNLKELTKQPKPQEEELDFTLL